MKNTIPGNAKPSKELDSGHVTTNLKVTPVFFWGGLFDSPEIFSCNKIHPTSRVSVPLNRCGIRSADAHLMPPLAARFPVTLDEKNEIMSYQLTFWKYKDPRIVDHLSTFNQLIEGLRVETVEEFPEKEIRQQILEKFGDSYTHLDPDTYETEGKGFQLFFTKQILSIDCGSLEAEELNTFIDICAPHECFLYDPQTNQRYDGSN